jgi:hypothetical protein
MIFHRSLVLALAIACASSTAAHGDNAPMWESPVGLAPGGPTAIQMAAEDVHVDVIERGASTLAVVDATFDMANPGPSTELVVGFPNFVHTVVPDDQYSPVTFTPARLTNFRAWTETATFHPAQQTINSGRFGGSDWFVWSMTYPSGPTRVYVSYEQALEPTDTPIVHATYVLRTGALWANAIGDAQVTFTASGGGGLVGGEQALEQTDQRIAWHFIDLKPTFDLDAAYVLAAPWQELQAAEVVVSHGDADATAFLRAAKAALQVLGTRGAYLQPLALVSHYGPAMRAWAAQATSLDTAESWEVLGDTEVYSAIPATKNHGELACWPDEAAAAYERGAALGSPTAAAKRTELDQTIDFMARVGMAAPPPCV